MLIAMSLLGVVAAGGGEAPLNEPADDTWVETQRQNAHLVAQAGYGYPNAPPSYVPDANRVWALTAERDTLRSKLYNNGAPAGFTGGGAAVLGLGALVFTFGLHMSFNPAFAGVATRTMSLSAFAGGLTGIVGGVLMIVFARIIGMQIEDYNHNLTSRISMLNAELEAIHAASVPRDSDYQPQ
jgi:hypothetical protein